MSLTLQAVALLAGQCAPEVALEAILPLVKVESAFNPLAINVNKGPRVSARDATEGAALVRHFVAAGYSVDVGLAQINSRNFNWLGLSVEDAFDPCRNLAASSAVLQLNYARASRSWTGTDAISATWSLYNTGTTARGFSNGYVGKIWSAADDLLRSGALRGVASAVIDSNGEADAPAQGRAPSAPPSSWVFGDVAPAVLVFK